MNLHLAWVIWQYGGNICAFLCCTWAFWKGGFTERVGAAIIATAWILSAFLTSRAGHGPGLYVAIIDITTFLAFVGLAIHSRRIWVIVAAACLFNSVISHFTNTLIHFGIYTYVTTIGLWGGWGLLLCLASGVWGHLRRRQSRNFTIESLE